MKTNDEKQLEQGYQVQVDDNFHDMDKSERWCLGNFETYEEALAAAKGLVEDFFQEVRPGQTAKGLYQSYMMLGDDPFIIAFGGAATPEPRFSAWNYAKQHAEELVCNRKTDCERPT